MYYCVFAKPEIPAAYFLGLIMPRSVRFYSITDFSGIFHNWSTPWWSTLVLCSHTVGGLPTKTCHSDIHYCSLPCTLSYLSMALSPLLLSLQVPCALCYLLPPRLSLVLSFTAVPRGCVCPLKHCHSYPCNRGPPPCNHGPLGVGWRARAGIQGKRKRKGRGERPL